MTAGVEMYEFGLAEGLEQALSMNVVSTFLLRYQLLSRLKVTAKERKKDKNMVFVGTMVHVLGKKKPVPKVSQCRVFYTSRDKKRADKITRYPPSKLMPSLLVRDLAMRGGTGILIIDDVNPGW